MRCKFAFILAASMVARCAAMAAPDEKFINLTVSNSAAVPIQILVRDLISGQTDEQNAVVATGKTHPRRRSLMRRALPSFFINVRFVDAKKGSYYRCLAFRGQSGTGD